MIIKVLAFDQWIQLEVFASMIHFIRFLNRIGTSVDGHAPSDSRRFHGQEKSDGHEPGLIDRWQGAAAVASLSRNRALCCLGHLSFS